MSTLGRGDADEIKRMESVNPSGFWAVLENVASTEFGSADATTIANAAACLERSGFLASHRRGELTSTCDSLCSCASAIDHWSPVTREISSGLSALCGIKKDASFSKGIITAVSRSLRKMDGEKADPVGVVDSVVTVLERADSLGHLDAQGSAITLPLDANMWLIAANHLYKGVAPRFWTRVRPQCEMADIVGLIQKAAASDELTNDLVNVIKATHSGPLSKKNWNDLVTAIEQRLDPAQGVGDSTATFDIYVLLEMKQLRIKEAAPTLKKLASNGHILHHFHGASDASRKSWIAFAHLLQQPNGEGPAANVGNSQAGYKLLQQYLKSPSDEDVKEFSSRIRSYDAGALLFDIAELTENCPLVVACLQGFAADESPEDFYTHEWPC
jgi:hypothetical protein